MNKEQVNNIISKLELNECLNERDVDNIICMAMNYYKKEKFTDEEIENTIEDYCFQWDIEK